MEKQVKISRKYQIMLLLWGIT